jgi:hypothetical protein
MCVLGVTAHKTSQHAVCVFLQILIATKDTLPFYNDSVQTYSLFKSVTPCNVVRATAVVPVAALHTHTHRRSHDADEPEGLRASRRTARGTGRSKDTDKCRVVTAQLGLLQAAGRSADHTSVHKVTTNSQADISCFVTYDVDPRTSAPGNCFIQLHKLLHSMK